MRPSSGKIIKIIAKQLHKAQGMLVSPRDSGIADTFCTLVSKADPCCY